MPHVGERVTIEVLEEFADAWNRHDVDALMAFMAEDCVFEASAGPDICGTRYVGREPCEPVSPESGRLFLMLVGAMRVISSVEQEGSRNGRLPEHMQTARMSKFRSVYVPRWQDCAKELLSQEPRTRVMGAVGYSRVMTSRLDQHRRG